MSKVGKPVIGRVPDMKLGIENIRVTGI